MTRTPKSITLRILGVAVSSALIIAAALQLGLAADVGIGLVLGVILGSMALRRRFGNVTNLPSSEVRTKLFFVLFTSILTVAILVRHNEVDRGLSDLALLSALW